MALENIEKVLAILINAINLIAACISMFLTVFYIFKKEKALNLLPKSLRWFINACFFPSIIIFAFGSIYLSISFLRHESVDLLSFKVVRVILACIAQLLRSTFLCLMLERVIATICLEKYSRKISHFLLAFCLGSFSWISSAAYSIPNINWIFFARGKAEFETIVYISLALHFVTLILCKILHFQNQKMYKLLAYRVSLHRRHQIVENIKVLKFLWPTIFIFSVLAPMGPISTWLYVYFTGVTAPAGLFHMENMGIGMPGKVSFVCQTGATAPAGLFHTWYNSTISLIFIFNLKFIFELNLRKNPHSMKNAITVVSPLGNYLPTTLPTEVYFNSLKEEWN